MSEQWMVPAPPAERKRRAAPLVAWVAGTLAVVFFIVMVGTFFRTSRYKTERDDARKETAGLSDVRADLTTAQSKLSDARDELDAAKDVGIELLFWVADCQRALDLVKQAADALNADGGEVVRANDLYNEAIPQIDACNTDRSS